MAPMRGNKNKNVIRDLGPKSPEEIESIPEEPQTSKDAELEALRKEVETLTEALRSQQWHDREEDSDFENPFAKQDHRFQEWGNHRMRSSYGDSRRGREPADLRFTMPRTHPHSNPHDFHREHAEEDVVFEDHRGLTHGSARAPCMAQVRTNPIPDPFQIGPNPGPGQNAENHQSLGLDRAPFARDRDRHNPNHPFPHEPRGYDRNPHRQQTFDRDLHHPHVVDHGFDREPRWGHGFNCEPPPFQEFGRDTQPPLGFG